MTAADSTLAEWLPSPGSDLHYSLLYAPSALRAPLMHVEAFRRHLVALPLDCSNPDIARAKLAWWHAEIHTLDPRRSPHALLRALAPLVAAVPALPSALFALVDGHGRLFDLARFDDAHARAATYARLHGPLWRVHGALCGLREESALEALAELGTTLELVYGLRDLRRVTRAGLAWLCHAHVPAQDRAMADADWYAEVARREIPFLRDALAHARERLPNRGPDARTLRTALVLADLADRLLQEIADDGARVWERRVDLTPLRKLWRALCVRSAT